MKIYAVNLMNVVLTKTEEEERGSECAPSLVEIGDALCVSEDVTIGTLMTAILPNEAQRMASEYARKAGPDKPKRSVESWSFCGFEETELKELPNERNTDVRQE